MSSLSINIPHQLTQEEALTRIKGLIEKLKQDQQGKYSGATEEWKGNTGHFAFSARGFDLSGDISVGSNSVDIQAKLPFALSFFQSQIKQMISDRAREILSA